MTATSYSTADIIAQFPVAADDMPTISTVTEKKPTYVSLTTFQNALNTNALSFPSTRGGRELGHLALALPPAGYASVSTGDIAFDPPNDPCITFVQPEGATVAQISENNHVFEISHSEDSVYINVCKALQKLILSKVHHPTYLEALCHPVLPSSYNHPSQPHMDDIWQHHLPRSYSQLNQNE